MFVTSGDFELAHLARGTGSCYKSAQMPLLTPEGQSNNSR